MNLCVALPLLFKEHNISEYIYPNILEYYRFFPPHRTKKGSRNVSVTLSLFPAGGLEKADKPAAFKSNKKASKTKIDVMEVYLIYY